MIFDPFFWRQRSRKNNPTYSASNLLKSTMVIPEDKNKPHQANYRENLQIRKSFSQVYIPHHIKNEQLNNSSSLLPKINKASSIQKSESKQMPKAWNNSKKLQSSAVLEQKLKKMTENKKIKQINQLYNSPAKIHRKKQSSYDNYDIIKGTQRNYKSTSKLFPKFHLQRLDNEYKTRQAFIKGDLSIINTIKNRKNNQDTFQPKSFFYTYKDYSILRRQQPIKKAFKITQNPEIISKKLILEK